MALTDLPDIAAANDSGHISDHNKILAALQALDAAKVESIIPGVIQSGAPGSNASAELVDLGGGMYALNLTIPAGATGATGATGADGATGPAGDSNVPSGGAARTFLMKATSGDFDFTYDVPSTTDIGAVPISRSVNTGTGLTGGGTLASDRTIAVSFGTTSGTALEGTQLGNPKGGAGVGTGTRYMGSTTSGAPTTGTFQTGDFVVSQDGSTWICTSGGSPGTWSGGATGTLQPSNIIAGSNVTVDRTTFPGSVVIAADALADLPPATGDVVTVRHDPDADAWYDAEGAEVTVRPSTPAWPRANVVWDSSLSPLVTSPPALAVRGDAWFPHGSVDPTA